MGCGGKVVTLEQKVQGPFNGEYEDIILELFSHSGNIKLDII